MRVKLLGCFERFDSAAIKWNERYQAVLYERSILPLITTAFLAVGFYAETLIGTVSKTLFANAATVASVMGIVAALLAGAGFLVHAGLNLYVFRRSKSKKIDGWQKNFVNNRYLAEVMRVLIHFAPYGMAPDVRRLCDVNPALRSWLMHVADEEEPEYVDLDKETIKEILLHADEMLEDQISYHKASGERFKGIVSSLEKWGKAIFYVGFGMVVARGALQFLIVLANQIYTNTAVLNAANIMNFLGSDYYSIIRSAMNMLALMLPAWAGYFTTKIQQNNFRYNLDSHRQAAQRLDVIHTRINRIMKQDSLNMEMFQVLMDDITEAMLAEDMVSWKKQYMGAVVKPL